MRFIFSVVFFCLLFSCQTATNTSEIAIEAAIANADFSLDDYKIETGFELSLIASEPILKAPVALSFDAKGRIWVAQMPGYMSDMHGSEEDKPIGSIKILEDADHDGVIDHVKTFLDSLVMPRALAHVYGGLLYAEPPFLYFSEIENDLPKNRIVVDSLYAADGNPEHQPNGLLLNIDNWIYNAKSNFRYQRENGVWKKEPTTFRGQWGISHDDFGRLYFNNNSQQLLGDHVLPNRLIRNKQFIPKMGVSRRLTEDQRVYPLHATTVNRGYAPGVLNADSILVHTTAAAGLTVYRGGIFPEGYDQNVFVSIPEGNLIKRNILTFTGDATSAKQAYENKEFLTSTDEGFRPVNVYTGPDGSMYIIDMHRGMIGHHAYLSPYLKKKNEKTRLDTILDFGRILKVKPIASKVKPIPDFGALNGAELVALLKHTNGWIRDRAQQDLISRNDESVLFDLKKMAQNTENVLAQIHALYVLEGLIMLDIDFLLEVASKSNAAVTAHSLVLIEQFASKENWSKANVLFKELLLRNELMIDLYVASSLGKWLPYEQKFFFHQSLFILKKYKDHPVVKEALLSGQVDGGEELEKGLDFVSYTDDQNFRVQLETSIKNKKEGKLNSIYSRKSNNEDTRTAGAKLFFQICASCHGANGDGIDGLAPPLLNSEHVADPQRLALIILHGLQGPVSVNGRSYNFNLAMPGLIRNEGISDKNIADIMAYVTNAFSDHPKTLKKEKIAELRSYKPKSGDEYTEEELINFSKKNTPTTSD